MHTVKLTVLIDDPGDIDMEVRVIAPDNGAVAATSGVATFKPRAVVAARNARDDDYVLGGYAGI
ncbi:MAG: hypothetical protein WBW32_12295 [Luteibacter sp.]